MKLLTATLLIFPVAAITGVIRAFSLMQLWNWLVAEEYGLPQLNGWEALGLSLVATAFLYQYRPLEDPETGQLQRAANVVIESVVYYGFAVLAAFIIYVSLP